MCCQPNDIDYSNLQYLQTYRNYHKNIIVHAILIKVEQE